MVSPCVHPSAGLPAAQPAIVWAAPDVYSIVALDNAFSEALEKCSVVGGEHKNVLDV